MKKILCVCLAALLLLAGCENNRVKPTEQLTELSDISYELHTLADDGISLKTGGTDPNSITNAVTWVANELVLNAQNNCTNLLLAPTLDLLLSDGSVTYKIPGFWDGDKVWRVRFVCPAAGTWTYETVCSDTSDAGLHGVKGTLTCTEYQGPLDIYKHGFVKTDTDKRYFTFADGTPFYYQGDTHWNLGGETIDMVVKMTDQRVKQGFTVIQSEPAGADYTLTDGISKNDLIGFADLDAKFQIIAEHGFVHANTQFFFPVEMQKLLSKYGFDKSKPIGSMNKDGVNIPFYDFSDKTKNVLDVYSRYWVARYAAYPVLWTLGQEVDNDFYWEADPSRSWSVCNNPYKYVCRYIDLYDPYQHPITAHMEGLPVTTAASSAFRDEEGHTWWAVQWGQGFGSSINFDPLIEFYRDNQGKPAVLYESSYCYLATKNYGARVQGWVGMLSGLCGYGWGGQDSWSYLNDYNEEIETSDGVDILRPAEKKSATYEDSLNYASAYQVGYMRAFFEKIVVNWYDLIPRFNDKDYLKRPFGSFGACASTEDGSKTVCYFYQTSDKNLVEKPNADENDVKKTGTLGNLKKNARYGYLWFNPAEGKVTFNGTFTADDNGQWEIGEKATGDMILYVYKIR